MIVMPASLRVQSRLIETIFPNTFLASRLKIIRIEHPRHVPSSVIA
jgi:hypothetical protein